MKIGFKHIILSTALASLAAPVAMAQSTDNPFLRGRYVAADQRHQPEFDPEPLHAGAFDIISSLGLSVDYNDNIFAQSNNEDDDTIIRIRPELAARSNWSAHELNAGFAVDSKQYMSNRDESTTDYSGYVGGRIDVQRAFQLRGRVNAAHTTEPRYAPAGGVTVDPVEYNTLGASVGAAFRSDRLQFEGDVGTTQDDFDGAANNFRDVTENYVFGRASYAVSPDVALFVQGRSGELDYDTSNRDGTRSWVQVGTSFELQAPFRGEIGIGSVKDEKDNPAFRDVDGLSLDGRLQWFPTQLTTVSFRANRGVFDPGIAAATDAVNTTWGARIDHELLRNVVLFGDASYTKYEFEGIDRDDKFTDFKVGAGYKLNKRMRLDAAYSLHHQESTGAARDLARPQLDQNILSVGLKLFP